MALHLQHFGLVQKGAESHSVLVTVSSSQLLLPQYVLMCGLSGPSSQQSHISGC